MNRDTKIIKNICNFVYFICIFLCFGFAGGLETETLDYTQFIIYGLITALIMILSIFVNNKMLKIERERSRVNWEARKYLRTK